MDDGSSGHYLAEQSIRQKARNEGNTHAFGRGRSVADGRIGLDLGLLARFVRVVLEEEERKEEHLWWSLSPGRVEGSVWTPYEVVAVGGGRRASVPATARTARQRAD